MAEPNAKQVLVVRTDLKMRKGKMVAQGAHAAMAFLTTRFIDIGNGKYEFGPFATPLYHGLAAAVEHLSVIGLCEIEARVRELTRRFRDALREIPKVRIYSPDGGPLATGIVAFGIEGVPGREIASELRTRWNVVARSTGIRFDGMRICIAFFNTEEELDTLADAVRGIAGKMT